MLLTLYTLLHLWLITQILIYGVMMPRFGKRSKERLSTCDDKLQKIFNEVIKYVDCSVLEGHRSAERQNKLFDEGKTKVKFPNGRHNSNPSRAVDVVPYPVDWDDRERFYLFAGFVIGIAQSMGIKLRWGGDWNMNFEVDDNKFDDFPHFELRKEK
jgi:peptidoglycan L-alanyl-D-glutamate endopeptidase CwlK